MQTLEVKDLVNLKKSLQIEEKKKNCKKVYSSKKFKKSNFVQLPKGYEIAACLKASKLLTHLGYSVGNQKSRLVSVNSGVGKYK